MPLIAFLPQGSFAFALFANAKWLLFNFGKMKSELERGAIDPVN